MSISPDDVYKKAIQLGFNPETDEIRLGRLLALSQSFYHQGFMEGVESLKTALEHARNGESV